MPLYTRDQLRSTRPLRKASVRQDARDLLKEAAQAPLDAEFDIFLSHRYLDADEVLGLKLDLERLDHSVYVDWLVDQTDRTKVNREVAERLRTRMRHCRCLFYALTEAAEGSKWMPWELGFSDGHHGRVAVVPILETERTTETYQGLEFLSLYPYISKERPAPSANPRLLQPGAAAQITDPVLWVQNSASEYVPFTAWLRGSEPRRRS